MSSKQFVAVTGFYGTGSSAVLDLLKEYDDVCVASPIEGDYEHVPFYSRGGLFDLASILLSPYSSVYTSDLAISSFIDSTNRLNENDFGWFGSYKKYYGDRYFEIADQFIRRISIKKERKNASHIIRTYFSLFRVLLQIAAKILYNRPINKWGRVYKYDKHSGYFSRPNKEEFGIAAREYTESYMNMCSKSSQINVFDHLVWPQECAELSLFFKDNFKVIIVTRDPRDIYLLNKYYWHKPPVSLAKPYFETTPIDFCHEWKKTTSYSVDSQNVLEIYFEDLVYDYHNTVNKIEVFLGINSTQHIKPKSYFIPEKSVENTQIFNTSLKWRNEISVFKEHLKEYFYKFPYERIPDKDKWFDAEGTTNK